MWVALFIGMGVLVCFYSMEWYARQNCRRLQVVFMSFGICCCVSDAGTFSVRSSHLHISSMTREIHISKRQKLIERLLYYDSTSRKSAPFWWAVLVTKLSALIEKCWRQYIARPCTSWTSLPASRHVWLCRDLSLTDVSIRKLCSVSNGSSHAVETRARPGCPREFPKPKLLR